MVDHAPGPPVGAATDVDLMLVQQRIESMLRRILKLDRKETIGCIPLCELGLSSMGAITLQYQFRTEFGADLKVSEILEARSIEQLARTLLSCLTNQESAVAAASTSGVLI